ncbi:MAG: hypothetical protein KA257_04355 [Opitutaceae bacterium]|nr:hypothetical protein [Opitutaceae bacterium]MBP9912042.1 hypothetical protein [Opitutaceae bacterium]
MLGALLYLRLTSLKNLLVARFQRLRQPKYLAGAIAGAAYFWFIFFRPSRGRSPRQVEGALEQVQVMAPEYLLIAAAVGALVLLIVFALMWLIPTEPAALGFSEAEIAFLFPAPVTRRALVHFKLLNSQFRTFFGAALMMLFSNRWTFLGGNPLTHAIGWWFIFSAINLHLTGSSFTLTRLGQHGLGLMRRRGLILALLMIVGTATYKSLPTGAVTPDFASLGQWLVQLAQTAPLSWLLFPIRLLLAPFFAADVPAFLQVIGPALLVLVAHYFWVVQSAVSFEDASIVKAEKRATRVAAWRSGQRRFGSSAPKAGRRPPFVLAGTGRPEFAFLWKNLLSTYASFNLRTLGIVAGLIFFGCTWAGRHAEWRILLTGFGSIVLSGGVYLLVVGPQFARQDIRSDLVHADILKTYPLPGWQIILGELLTPAFILTGLLWLVLFTGALTIYPQQGDFAGLTPLIRVGLTACLMVIAPVLVTLQLLVPNAATLLFPAWFQSARPRERGIEVMGQRMIFFFAQILTMLLALLPAVLLAGGLAYVTQWLLGPVAAALVATVIIVAVLIAEIAGGLWWLGRRFEKFDLSDELRP